MMVKVAPHGYATEVFPSRGIAGRLEEEAAFWVVEVVRMAHEMELARFGKPSVDGPKVRANAGIT